MAERPAERFEVRQHLTLSATQIVGTNLCATVFSSTGRRHEITFHFDDELEALIHAMQLEEWRSSARPLTYVRGGGRGVLVDDEELFRRAFGDEPVH